MLSNAKGKLRLSLASKSDAAAAAATAGEDAPAATPANPGNGAASSDVLGGFEPGE